MLRVLCAISIVAVVFFGAIGAELSTRDRIRIHKEWLERRAAQKTHSSTTVLPQASDATTQRTTYTFRKLIKFSVQNEPLSENDVSFVPHFEGDAGGGSGAGGGSNVAEGVNKGVSVANGAAKQPEASHHRRDQQGRELHHHRLHHGGHATPQPELRGKDLLTEDGDRYRYEVVTAQEAGVSEPAHPLGAQERKETDSKPVVYVMGPSGGDEAGLGTPAPDFEEHPRPTVATDVAQINVPLWLLYQNRSAGTSDNAPPGPNDLSSGSSISETTTSHKLDAPTEEPNATGNVAVHVRSSTKPAGEGAVPDPTATNSVEEPRMTALALPSSPSTTLQLADGNVTVRNLFSAWSNWTACSRTCGGGVKTQHRVCWKREYINGKKSTKPGVESNECIGIIKRFHLCNEQDCPITDGDFREQQCARFNNQTFQDKRYIWEAFVKEDAECELNCKPIGMRYFATLNKTVVDGTPCIKPTEYFRNNESTVGRGICVEGVCKAVHNSGVISGTFMNYGAVRCGTTVCRPISGIYTKTNHNNGYVHVAKIPPGASNITITELQNSQNYLALKSADQRFFINGDYTISLSGHYSAAGTVFDYRRVDGLTNGSNSSFRHVEGITEWVTAPGPTTEPVQLFLLSQSPNPGVKYEYLLPVNDALTGEPSSLEDPSAEAGNDISEKANLRVPKQQRPAASTTANATMPTTGRVGQRKRKYLWKVVGFSACSKSCGGGIQQPVIRCVRESPTRNFPVKRCAHLPQPVLNENLMRCNTQPCPAYWKLGDWGQCNCEERYDEEVLRTREVKCVQELLSGIVIQVSNGACMDELPPSTERCECSRVVKPTPARNAGERPHHKPTGQSSQDGQHQHHSAHHGHRGHQHSRDHEATTTLLTQNDMDNGSSSARPINNGPAHRRKPRPDSNTISQQAESKKTGVWLTANWSARCSTTCGIGLQTRSIFCDRSSSRNSERCDLRLMPETTRECTSDRACEFGEWFTGPWTLCSGDCFNLTRSRTVLCIRNDHFAPESECDPDSRPKTIEPCDTESFDECKPRWHYSEWTDCTKPCGSGNQRRVVKCLEFNLRDKMLQESVGCRYADRPTSYRVCNEEACPLTTVPPTTTTTTTTYYPATLSTSFAPSADPYYESRTDMMSNDENCRDDFPNCTIVLKAKLCTYAYYSQACCQTCRTRQNELY